MKNKQTKGLSLSANPISLNKGTFFATTKVFTEFFDKIKVFGNSTHRAKLADDTQVSSPTPVILGLVPKIFLQRISKLVNKFALLFKRSMFTEDSRDKPENDGCRGRWLRVFHTSPLNVILRRYSLPEVPRRRIHNAIAYAMSIFFKHPSPEAFASTYPSGGEVKNNALHKGLDVVRQYAALLERGVQNSTRVRKVQVETQQTNPLGRSMIEMLGVLAIIAVLSVGGISGYSKAMEMYKLNKWQEGLIQTINNIQTAYLNQKSYTTKEEDITNFLISADIIQTSYVDISHKDSFGNILSVFTIGWKNYGLRFELKYQMPAGKDAVNCCKKLYELPKYYNSIWAVGDWTSYTVCGKAAPSQYAKDMNCQEYSLDKALQKCNTCKTQNCGIGILFDNNPS